MSFLSRRILILDILTKINIATDETMSLNNTTDIGEYVSRATFAQTKENPQKIIDTIKAIYTFPFFIGYKCSFNINEKKIIKIVTNQP